MSMAAEFLRVEIFDGAVESVAGCWLLNPKAA
jgi:hypothetical protein